MIVILLDLMVRLAPIPDSATAKRIFKANNVINAKMDSMVFPLANLVDVTKMVA